MKILLLVFNWLKQTIAKSIITSIIVMLLAIIFAAIANRWLESEFLELNEFLDEEKIEKWEYWGVLVAVFIALQFLVLLVESTIATVVITRFEKKDES